MIDELKLKSNIRKLLELNTYNRNLKRRKPKINYSFETPKSNTQSLREGEFTYWNCF
jgi:hypothetical protein